MAERLKYTPTMPGEMPPELMRDRFAAAWARLSDQDRAEVLRLIEALLHN